MIDTAIRRLKDIAEDYGNFDFRSEAQKAAAGLIRQQLASIEQAEGNRADHFAKLMRSFSEYELFSTICQMCDDYLARQQENMEKLVKK